MQSKISDVSFSIEFRFVTKIGCFVTRLCLFAHKYSSIHFLSLQWHQIYCEKDPTFISSVIFVISIMLMNVFASPYSFGNITLIPVHFSETAQQIFLIFCMKLGDYKGRKVTKPDLWKKLLILLSDTLIFFSKPAPTICLVFGLKLVLNMTFNLNETYFSEKFAISRYLALKSSKNCPNGGFWTFSRLWIISFPWFCTQR